LEVTAQYSIKIPSPSAPGKFMARITVVFAFASLALLVCAVPIAEETCAVEGCEQDQASAMLQRANIQSHLRRGFSRVHWPIPESLTGEG